MFRNGGILTHILMFIALRTPPQMHEITFTGMIATLSSCMTRIETVGDGPLEVELRSSDFSYGEAAYY